MKKKRILLVLCISFMYILLLEKYSNATINGNVYERLEMIDNEGSISYEDVGIKDMKVYLKEKEDIFVLTNEEGYYEFPSEYDENSYHAVISYGEVSDYKDIEKTKQQLKYNSQDYECIYLSSGISENEADVVLLIDTSGSMSSGRLSICKTACSYLIEKLLEINSGLKIAIVQFSSNSSLAGPITNDTEKIKSTINGLSAGGGTYVIKGFDKAIECLETTDSEKKRFCILLTDGIASESSEEISEKIKYMQTEKNIYVVSLLVYTDNSLSYYDAYNSSNKHGYITDDELEATYASIFDQLVRILESQLINNNDLNDFSYKGLIKFSMIDNYSTDNEAMAREISENFSGKIILMGHGAKAILAFKQPASLEVTSKMTEIKMTLLNGQVVFDDRDLGDFILKTIDENTYYGSKLYVKYEIKVKNVSDIKCNYLELISILPEYATKCEFRSSLDESQFKYENVNINNLVTNKYLSKDFYEYKERTGIKITCGNKDLKNLELNPNDEINIQLYMIRYNSTDADDYNVNELYTEVLTYANTSNRRMFSTSDSIQYKDTDITVKNYKALYPGNLNEIEYDASKAPKAVLVPPTGSTKTSCILAIFIILIIAGVVIYIEKKKIEKSIISNKN